MWDKSYFLAKADPEDFLYSDQDLYSYQEFGLMISKISDGYKLFLEVFPSERSKTPKSVQKYIYLKGNKEFEI